MRAHLLLALCLSFSQIQAAPADPIKSLQAELLSIIGQVQCFEGKSFSIPEILTKYNPDAKITNECSIDANAATSTSAAHTSISSLQIQASPKWSSLQSMLSTTTSLPAILTTIPSALPTAAATSLTSSSAPSITPTSSPPSDSSESDTCEAEYPGDSSSSTPTSTLNAPSSKKTACAGNTASDRSSWCDLSTSTDYYNEIPDTGVTREYWLEVEEGTLAPDGFQRYAQTVNGSYPGPTLFSDWGDTVVVHVKNKLAHNGTTMHFHGIRQNYTNQNDGVPSVTQCPIAPGESYTYTWVATQYGSSWYHSHVGLQAWEGVAGGIVVNGPATANYDEDKGIMFLADWGHSTVDELFQYAQTKGPPQLDTGLINGTNVFGEDGSSNQTGTRFSTSVESGTSYLLRIVNGAINTHWKFSIDNHTMTVISNDFVPIKPYQTDILNIAIGQRYDVVITADQQNVASDFWIRSIPQKACSSTSNVDNIKGVLHYGSSTGVPTTTGYAFTDECVDEPASNLVPFVAKDVSAAVGTADEAVTIHPNEQNLFRWFLNNSTFESDWKDPTVLQVQNGSTAFAAAENLITLPGANEWFYLIIHADAVAPIPHPIHMHGHDFYVIAQATGTFDASTVKYNLSNPPRRDVALLPAVGYLVLAFQTDNPGAWLAHCHIGWHTTQGFALQFLEQADKIPALLDANALQNTCDKWNAAGIQQDDSGV